MTKNDKVKLGIAVASLILAVAILIWYFFFSSPKESAPDAAPPATSAPNSRIAPGARK